MSFFRPIITDNKQAFLTTSLNALFDDFVIGPYDFNKENILKCPSEFLLLFNFPDEIDVFIDNINLPGSRFDYYNPLLMNNRIFEKIKFYNKSTCQIIDEFSCSCLVSKSLQSIFHQVLDIPIYYPPECCIDYKSLTATRIVKGIQFCNLITNLNQQQTLSIPITINRSIHNPNFGLENETVMIPGVESLLNIIRNINDSDNVLQNTEFNYHSSYDEQSFQ